MTCTIRNAATLRAQAEALHDAYSAAVSRGDAARGRILWSQYRDADWIAYQAEREELRAEIEARYPLCD